MLNLLLSRLRKPKPPQSPFALGTALLDKLSDLEKRIVELEKPREVQTHYASDHEEIQKIKKWMVETDKQIPMVIELENRNSINEALVQGIISRIKHLEQSRITDLTAKIKLAAKPSVKKRPSRAVRGKHVSA